MDFNQHFRRQRQKRKQDELQEIKKVFVDSGKYDELINSINKQIDNKPKIEDIPF